MPSNALAITAAFPSRLSFLFRPKRYKVAYGGRGGCKTWNFARALLILGAQRSLRVLCAREFQNSIAESVHKVLSDQIDMLSFDGQAGRPLYIVEKARIYCPDTGTEFYFEGIRNNVNRIKSYEGINICWVEEANKVSKASWEVLIPTVRIEGSEIWVSFNPELETDETFLRFVKTAREDATIELKDSKGPFGWETPSMIVAKLNWSDNPWFPAPLRAEMESLKAKDLDAYLNIWEGECRVMLDGAVYANELRDVTKDGRITTVPYERSAPVDTFWDLGFADATSIWFGQAIGFEYRIIDFYENSQKALDHYLGVLQQKGYIYGNLWLPFDAKAKTIGTRLSVEEQCRAKGYSVRSVPRLSLTDGITAARTIFPNCFFDAKRCTDGIQALRHYCYETDGKGITSREPKHDAYSHAADAFRYLAIALKQPRRAASEGVFSGLSAAVERVRGIFGSEHPQSWMGM